MCNKQPKAPDPIATANAQGQANIDAAVNTAGLNRPDQITPWGSQTWENDPSDPTKWTSTTTLSENQQRLNDTQDDIALGLGDAQMAGLGRVDDTFGQPLDTSGLTQRVDVNDAMNLAIDSSIKPRSDLYQASIGYANMGIDNLANASNNYERTLGQEMPSGERVTTPEQFNQAGGAVPQFGGLPTQGRPQPRQVSLAQGANNATGSGLQVTGVPQGQQPQGPQQFPNNGPAGGAPQFSAPAQGVPQPTGLEGSVGAFQAPESTLESFSGMDGEVPTYRGPSELMPENTSYDAMKEYEKVTGNLPTADMGYRTQIQDAMYNQQKSRLDPRFDQRSQDLEARLATQGITQGSEAYNREMQNLGLERNDAYQGAMNNSITAGEGAIDSQYGRDMQGRQQLVGESDLDFQNRLAGNTTNNAQKTQQFENEALKRQMSLAESGQEFDANLQGRQQGFNEVDQAFQNNLALQDQNFNQANQGFANNLEARQQNYNENDNNFQNSFAAQGQEFDQANQGFANNMDSRQQQFGEADQTFQNQMASRQQQVGENAQEYEARLAGAQQNLGANAQYFNQDMAARDQSGREYSNAAAISDAMAGRTLQAADGLERATNNAPGLAQGMVGLAAGTRADELSEATSLRNMPLNELNALRSGAQVTTPQFGSGQSGATVGAAPIARSTYDSYNGESANYNAMMGGLASLGGAAMGMPRIGGS
jgi:hypothetical protein